MKRTLGISRRASPTRIPACHAGSFKSPVRFAWDKRRSRLTSEWLAPVETLFTFSAEGDLRTTAPKHPLEFAASQEHPTIWAPRASHPKPLKELDASEWLREGCADHIKLRVGHVYRRKAHALRLR